MALSPILSSLLQSQIKKTGVTALPTITPNTGTNTGIVKPGSTGIAAAKSGSLTMPYTPGTGTSANTGINGGVTKLPNVSGGVSLPSTATKMTSGVTLPSSTSGMQTMSATTGSSSTLSPAMVAEIQRKAAAGIPLDEPTAEKTAIYNQAKAGATSTVTSGGTGKAGGTVATPSNSSSNTPMVQYSNDYMDKATQLMAQLETMMNNGYNFDYAKDPTFMAAQQMAQSGAKTASLDAMESMNDRGIMNSSLMGNQLAQIEQQAQLKPMELIPQLQAQAYNQYQGGISNLATLMQGYLSTGQSQLDYAQNKALNEAIATGKYIAPEAALQINNAIGQDVMNTSNPAGASTLSANKIAEIQRKAAAGIPLDEPTAEAMAIYTAAGGNSSTGASKSTSSSSGTKTTTSSGSSSSSTKTTTPAAAANENAYLKNMAAGKNADGSAANAGQVAWAKAQLAKK